MKKTPLLMIAIFFIAITAKADEGMWLLKELNRRSVARMKELGFTFPINKLYDENNPSLKDAVVIFGRGCTGVAVSHDGLIFTNHHCGYGAIQKLSAVEHDYLKDGFAAQTKADDLHAEGLTVSFLKSMEDVTDRILPKVPSVLSEVQRDQLIDSLSNELLKPYQNDKFVNARVIPFYTHNKYYVVVYDVFRDVRLAVAPPSSIGKFGGDTDNWMWPRQTGDFSVFRVYANKDNQPAEYSEDNVPYRPKYVVPISLKGVSEGDFAMTVGYPGRTQRYMSSWGIRQMMESENKPRIEVRGEKQRIWWDAMTKDDAVRIKYASKYAGSSNYWKNAMGMNEALTKLHVLKEKEKLENRLSQWINSTESNKQRYGNTLATLKESYEGSNEQAKYGTYFMETFNNGIEIVNFANSILRFDTKATQAEKEEYVRDRFVEAYKDYEPQLDQKVMPVLMKLYAERVPEEYHPSVYKTIKEEFGGNYQKYADWVFANSKFTKLEDLLGLIKQVDEEALMKDPAMILASSVRETAMALFGNMSSTYEKIMRGEREFMAALMEMDKNKTFYPDANFTQRLSYGSVEGYKPRDAVWYNYFTTTEGVLEKEKPGDPEFNVQLYILDLLRGRDFGNYASKSGQLHTGFLSTNDITGGNSGSPVLNGNAELIGLAFDGNWEALSGDIIFEPQMQRTISVDIRYVLYVIDKVMKAPHIIDELTVVQ